MKILYNMNRDNSNWQTWKKACLWQFGSRLCTIIIPQRCVSLCQNLPLTGLLQSSQLLWTLLVDTSSCFALLMFCVAENKS